MSPTRSGNFGVRTHVQALEMLVQELRRLDPHISHLQVRFERDTNDGIWLVYRAEIRDYHAHNEADHSVPGIEEGKSAILPNSGML